MLPFHIIPPNPDEIDIIALRNENDTCPTGFFKCNGTAECVTQRKNCDSIADCENGSDEWNCYDESETLFWDHFFRKRPGAESDDIPLNDCSKYKHIWHIFGIYLKF